MSGHQYGALGDTFYVGFSVNDTSGSGIDGSTPLFDVRLGGAAASAAPVLSGTPDLLSHANFQPGAYECAIAATTGNGFAADATYLVYATVTADSQTPAAFIGSFRLREVAGEDQIASLGGTTGGGFSVETILDNTVIDTINDAEDAVDKSTSPATVGIPITGHAFVAGQYVTIAGTANYNAEHVVDSVSTNEIVIVATFAAETFSSSDTVKSTVKGVAFVGSVQGGTTVANTEALNGVFHDIDASGSDIDIVYTFVPGGRLTGTELIFHGFVQSNGDAMDIEVWDHVADGWEVLRPLSGSNSSNVITQEVPLLRKHTGTSGADLGRVYVRFDLNIAPTNLSVDQLLVEAINKGTSNAYDNGQIWIDTNASNTNTEVDFDGTSRNPVSTIAAAKTLSTSTGLGDFHVINGSSITFAESAANESYFGDNWTLALGGQDCSGVYVRGANVSGTATGSTEMHFRDCEMGTSTLAQTHFDDCDLEGTITLSAAATYNFDNCSHEGTPVIDCGTSVGNQIIHVHGYEGALEVKNLGETGTDVLHFSGKGKLTMNASCVAGTVNLNGVFEFINNGSGMTVNRGGDIVDLASLEKAMTEIAQGVPSATPGVRDGIMLMYMALRNKLDVPTSGIDTLEIHNSAGTRITQKLLTDSAGDYSEAKMTSGA